MALTLIEAAKLHDGVDLRSTVIELYAQSSDLLRVLPFDTIAGNALKYSQEKTLPGIAFRGVNGSYTESTGVLNPVVEPLVIAGGDLDVDTHILRTMGMDQRSVHEAMKIKALAHGWTKTFLKGDSVSSPYEFDGLQVRLTGNQKISAGATAGGDALSLAKLDEAIDAVENPTHLCMNKAMRRRLTAAMRSTEVSGNIAWDKDEFGRRILVYNDLPILIFDEDNTAAQILPFTEASANGGASVCTSIYVVSLGDQRLLGIQSGDMMVTDLGELQTKPAMRTRVEWDCGVALWHPKAASRLYGIKNAAVTV